MDVKYSPSQSGTSSTRYTDQVNQRPLRSHDQMRTIQRIETDSGSSGSFSSEVENNSTSSRQARVSRFASILLGLLVLVGVITGVAIFVKEKAPLRRTKSSASSAVSYQELAAHDSPVDCWLAIHGQVFDLTEYEHPGGPDYIYDQCGADATNAYGIVHAESLLVTAEPFFRGFLQDERVSTETPVGTAESPSASVMPTAIGEESYINSSQLALHNLAETDCWVVYHGRVFDMTSYATEHPGGPANITDFCGSDATEEFAASHPVGYLNFIAKYNVGFYQGPMSNHTITIESPAMSPSVISPEPALREIQLIDAEELSTHDDPDTDCWVVYHGSVYNMTEYAAKHPGGPGNITDFCGTDSTVEYAAVHSITYLGLIKKYLVGFSSEPSAYTPPPTSKPSTNSPTHVPTGTPTVSPTAMPTISPSAKPTVRTTSLPTSMPTVKPSPLPTPRPVSATLDPSPTQSPSQMPVTSSPTNTISQAPVSSSPTGKPTASSTIAQTASLLQSTGTPPPSRAPTTRYPTSSPVTTNPTSSPTQTPTKSPTSTPTKPPTNTPSLAPTLTPSKTPTAIPTTAGPTKSPITALPTGSPTIKPTQLPGQCYKIEEVAQHASESDCWYILYGDVYDFTDYMDRHPAGSELIANECGTDATLVFETAKKHDAKLLVKKGGDAYKIGLSC